MPTVSKFPTANTSASGFNGTWTNPNNAQADDGVYATVANMGRNKEFATYWHGFDFSAIPAGSTINSVSVEAQWKVSTTGSVATLRSTAFSDHASGTASTAIGNSPSVEDAAEPTADTIRTYSIPATLAELKGTGFAIRVQALQGNTNTGFTGSLDYVKVTVDYTAPPTPVSGSGGVAFGISTAGTGAVIDAPAGIVGSGGVAFGLSTAGSGSYSVTPITGSGSVAFSPATGGVGTVQLPSFTGTGGVAFGFSLSGTGGQTASVHGTGAVAFGVASGGSGAVLPPDISASGGVSFGIATAGEGAYSVTPIDGAGAVSAGIATAGSGTVSPPPITGSGGVTFGFSTSGASRTAGGPPWVREGVIHLGHKPHH